jgi:hypothetical protein
LQRQSNAIDTNKYLSITKLTRVEMQLSITHQHQAATAKSFVARQRQTMTASRRAREDCKVQGNVDEFKQTSSGERA